MQTTFDRIQNLCGYSDLDTLRVVWKKTMPGERFPKRHNPVDPVLIMPFLQALATPTPGKNPAVVSGAQSLIIGSKPIAPPAPEPNPVPEKVKRPNPEPAPVPNPVPNPVPEKVKRPNPEPVAPPNPEPIIEPRQTVFERIAKRFDFNNYVWILVISVASVVYGSFYFLDGVGLIFSAIYALVIKEAFTASQRQNAFNERGLGIVAVIALECFAGFIHFGWLNIKLWEKESKLPFHWSDTIAGQTINTTPGIIATVFATIMSVASVYAVWQQINRTVDNMFE